jgi:3-methyladenine DNA glycosylase AlkD
MIYTNAIKMLLTRVAPTKGHVTQYPYKASVLFESGFSKTQLIKSYPRHIIDPTFIILGDMKMVDIVDKIIKELKAVSTEKELSSISKFFKEPLSAFGCNSVKVMKIFRSNFKNKKFEFDEAWGIAMKLFEHPELEAFGIGVRILQKVVTSMDFSYLAKFEKIIENRVSNWAECDTICTAVVYHLIKPDKKSFELLDDWSSNKNRWLKRSSAVILVPCVEDKAYLSFLFEQADRLITVRDDMVEKGIGWVLKVASKYHYPEIKQFMLDNYSKMTRTTLRYAIEHFPKEDRQYVLKLK